MQRGTRTIVGVMIGVVLLGAARRATATPYQIGYEANTPGSFPEDEGWRRTTGASSGATRTVQDGLFTLSSDDITVTDNYFWDRPNNLDPESGESFFTEWRVLVSDISNPDLWDPAVTIASNGFRLVDFILAPDRVVDGSTFASFQYTLGVFHTFRLETVDMLAYELFVDDIPALSGSFQDSLSSSFVAFGDGVGGVSSTSDWDYVRFGVIAIPEPSTVFLFCLAALPLLLRGEVPG